ncbi:MAG: hypothetical protein ACYC3Q_13695 [Gemmatimonadaceae bacterium]
MAHLDGPEPESSSTGSDGTAATTPTLPLAQRLYDNVFLLLALGVVIMIAVYTGWGIWEVVTMPQGTLP